MQRFNYAECIEISKRVRWDIEKDVIRGRSFDFSKRFLPDGISMVNRLPFLTEEQKRLLSQIQGRTYANMFGFVERFITAKILDITRDHWLDDQVAAAVLKNSTWAVLGLILEIELFTQEHYKQSIAGDEDISELYRDLFLFHWKEETTHSIMDELEWPREDKKLSNEERDRAIEELIGLVVDVDGILRVQSNADVEYFCKASGASFAAEEMQLLRAGVLKAYRWQYIFSGVDHPRYRTTLSSLVSEEQTQRIDRALASLR